MTTVAYRNGIIAADRRVSSGQIAEGQMTKIVKRGKVLAGAAGECIWIAAFLDWVTNGCEGDPPTPDDKETAFDCFIVADGKLIIFEDGKGFEMSSPFYAVGSGKLVALGAMGMNAGTVKAVKVASRFDVYTGPEVDWLTLSDG